MYTAKDFSSLLGTEGLSDALLNTHFTLYQGYVTNTNKLLDLMKEKEAGLPAQAGTPEFAELHRRFGWEWNGMRLHELYFGNMVKGGSALPDGALKQKIESTWGSFDAWQKEFQGLGAMRGIGWVVLAYDIAGDKLMNVWINEHDVGHLAGASVVLIMDVFEHAYMADYGTKKPDYISAFFKAIDWKTVSERI